MSTWDKQSHYYSGQGVVLLGSRDANGLPVKLLPVGNVSSLKTTIATTVVEHYEAQSGARGLDLRLTTKVSATLSMVLENYNSVNLATALRGTNTTVNAGSTTTEAGKWWSGAVIPLQNLSVSAYSLKRGATPLVLFTNNSTPWDYKLNAAAGSVQFNDGSLQPMSAITTGGTVPSAITAGNPTVITVANTASVGDYVVFTGFSGADAALVNGIPALITVASSTSVSIAINTAGKTLTVGTPLSCFEGQALVHGYTFAGQFLVDSLVNAATDYYLRFEGLNTAETNQSVVIEVFRFSSDPLKELDLISDTIQQFTLDGSILADALQPTGSKYFTVTKLV